MSATVLCVHGLEMRAGGRHGERVLFSGLDLRVARGQRWVVLGPNGSGKSTLLAALAGLLPVQGGRIEWHGRAVAAWSPAPLSAERAWCPQFWLDPFPARVDETVRLARLPIAWAGRSDDGDGAALDALLKRLDLAHLRAHDVRTLSGGERQRVAIAAAFWQGAPALLLDEPASHLDLAHQQVLVQRLREHADGGGLVVTSLHDLNLAWTLATHAVLLDGRASAIAGPRDVVLTPEHLGAAFGVAVSRVEVCGQHRFWIGPST